MANATLALSIVAILIAAGAIGWTAVALGPITSDISSIKEQLSAISGDVSGVKGQLSNLQNVQGQLRSDINALKSAQQGISAEQAAIRRLVEERIGGLEEALEEARKIQAELREAQLEAEERAQALGQELERTKQVLEETRQVLEEREALLKEVALFDPELVAAALNEGELVIYSVRDQEDLVLFAQEFQKQFPGIKVSFLTAKNPELIARIQAEFQAGQKTWDVFDSSVTAGRLVAEAGAVEPYRSPQATPENFPIIDPLGQLNFFGATIPVVIYNPNLVTDEELQLLKSLREWDDLTSDEFIETFRGRVLMDHPSRGGPHSQVLAELRTFWNDDDRWFEHMRRLTELEPRLFKSTGQIGRLIIAEEGTIGIIGLLHDVLRGKKVGAPIDFIALSPLILNPSMLVISKLAPHPNAAKLFVEFMLSPQGQATFAMTLRSPMRLGFVADSSISVLFPDIPPEEIIGITNEEFQRDAKGFIERYYVPIFGPA